MPWHRTVIVLAAVLAIPVLAAVRPAAASTVVPVTVETLARRADEVLVVTPRGSSAQWLARRIVTDYDLEVQSVVRGAVVPRAHVTLRAAGGIVGRIGQEVPGVPALAIDRPYVVFLTRAPGLAGVYYFAHLTAAALPIVAAPDGTLVALPALEGMRVQPTAVSGPGALASQATSMVRAGLPLEQFVRLLRSAQ